MRSMYWLLLADATWVACSEAEVPGGRGLGTTSPCSRYHHELCFNFTFSTLQFEQSRFVFLSIQMRLVGSTSFSNGFFPAQIFYSGLIFRPCSGAICSVVWHFGTHVSLTLCSLFSPRNHSFLCSAAYPASHLQRNYPSPCQTMKPIQSSWH